MIDPSCRTSRNLLTPDTAELTEGDFSSPKAQANAKVCPRSYALTLQIKHSQQKSKRPHKRTPSPSPSASPSEESESEADDASASESEDSDAPASRRKRQRVDAKPKPKPVHRSSVDHKPTRKASSSLAPGQLPPARAHVQGKLTEVVAALFEGKMSENKAGLYAKELEAALWDGFKEVAAGKEVVGGKYK